MFSLIIIHKVNYFCVGCILMFFWKNIIYKSIFEFFSTFYEGEIIRLYFAEQREFRESIEKYMNDQEQQVNED